MKYNSFIITTKMWGDGSVLLDTERLMRRMYNSHNSLVTQLSLSCKPPNKIHNVFNLVALVRHASCALIHQNARFNTLDIRTFH